MASILVVDDKASLRQTLEIMLQEEGHDAHMAANVAEARSTLINQRVDMVLTDLRLGAESGLDVIRLVKETDPSIEVVLMTAFGSVDSAVEAMKLGAYDYVLKPFDAPQLKKLLEHALERRSLASEIASLRAELERNQGTSTLIGTNPQFLEVLSTLKQVAKTDAPVLILGESGTGKELLARYLHENSRRKDNPLVAVNCAALPEPLLESEMFGYAKGAFTDAHSARGGLLEESHTGTFFMDEVGETSTRLQAKLLRVLQEREVRRLGENQARPVDFRLVSATHQDIGRLIKDQRMREDFLFRINVIVVKVPSLRERPEDIPLLANHFLNKQARLLGKSDLWFDEAAMDSLLAYDWPGNVRELGNVVERAAVLSHASRISRETIQPNLGQGLGRIPSTPIPKVAPSPLHHTTSSSPDEEGTWVSFKDKPLMENIEDQYLAYLFDQEGLTIAQVQKITGLSASTLKRRRKLRGAGE